MILKECKSVEDVKNRGLENMKKREFTPLKVEIEDQFMKFFGAKFHKEDLENEAKQRQNKDWYVLVSKTKIRGQVPYDFCAFKIDLAKYVDEYKSKYKVSRKKVKFDEMLLRKKAPLIPAGFQSLQVQ